MTPSVLLLHYTPPGVVGGVEAVLHQHVRLLRNRGFTVRVVAGRPRDDALVVPQFDAAHPQSRQVESELDSGVVTSRFYQQIADITSVLEPLVQTSDVVIAHNAFTLHFNLPLTAALWRVAAFRPGSVVAWSHDLSWTNPLYLPLLHDGYPWDLLRRPAPGVRYVTVSELRARELRGLWGRADSVQVIPNGIDPSAFLRLSPQVRRIVDHYRLFDRDAVLLLPVRVTRRKNIEAGIRAVAALRARGKDVLFLVSGPQAPHHPGRSDQYLGELNDLRHQLGVAENVAFLAADCGLSLSLEEVTELYGVADVLLFPSSQEGFGLPILEAALARVPVVVSDIPIFREVGDDHVYTVSLDDDADTMAGVVLRAMDTAPVRLRRRVLDRYRWEVIADNLLVPLIAQSSRRPAPSTF